MTFLRTGSKTRKRRKYGDRGKSQYPSGILTITSSGDSVVVIMEVVGTAVVVASRLKSGRLDTNRVH